MKNDLTVGASSRTPYKHWLYNFHLGAMIGSAGTGNAACSRNAVVLDLCAGDGVETYDPNGKPASSPGIGIHHMTSRTHGLMHREVHLFEKQQSTFDKLLKNCAHCKDRNLHLYNMDSSAVRVGDYSKDPKAAVFVYADPNSVASLPINQEMVDSFTPYTLFLLTLGCNAGGVKQLSRQHREKWFDMVKIITGAKSRSHDFQLIWLVRDSDQWAYMLSVPKVWEERKEKLAKAIAAGNKLWPKGVDGISVHRHGQAAFDAKIEDLFLTKEEKTV